MELSKEEINALNWAANGCKAECEEDEDKVIDAFKALGKIKGFDSSVFYSNAIIIPCGADVREFGNKKVKIEIVPELENKNVLPHPVIRDGNGKLATHYSLRDWHLKLQEEIFEVMDGKDDFDDNHIAEEIADVITVCISWLETLGYDEEKRSELFAAVNEKNENRGYFKESE